MLDQFHCLRSAGGKNKNVHFYSENSGRRDKHTSFENTSIVSLKAYFHNLGLVVSPFEANPRQFISSMRFSRAFEVNVKKQVQFTFL